MTLSLRFARSMTQSIGIPSGSVAANHFGPDLPRSAGLGPHDSRRDAAQAAVVSDLSQIRTDDLVMGGE
jgi:hypothetical protein